MLTCVTASGANASGVTDGEAGLKALQSGGYDEAIRLFTRAIDAGDLSADDREFAYLNRGKAYLAKGDRKDAVVDLRQAANLKPDDNEARDALQSASGSGAPRIAGQFTTSTSTAFADRWGLLATMAGHYYWYELQGKDPHTAVFHAQWATPGKILSTTVRSKSAQAALGETELDSKNNLLISIVSSGGHAFYGVVDATPRVVTSYMYTNAPVLVSYQLLSDGSISYLERSYENGEWLPSGSAATLVEVSEAELSAQGFLKKR